VKYFRHMPVARHFTILTEHNPLIIAFHQKRDICSQRPFDHLDFISQFTTDIRHISGQENIVADALSRLEAITAPVRHDSLAAAQADDDELRTLLESSTTLKQKRPHPSVFQVVSFLQDSPTKPCIRMYSNPYVLHDPLILFLSI